MRPSREKHDDTCPAHSWPAAGVRRRRGPVVAAVAMLLTAMWTMPAAASKLDADIVAGRPLGQSPSLEAVAPDVTLPAGILTDAAGRVLWERKAHQPRAMASTTKIMTAIVVLENAKLSDEVTISRAAADVGESGAGLVAGERLTVRQLLEALLVKSANDAAVALAEHTGGSVAGFAAMMNAKAAALGMTETHFKNPHGLDAPGHQTSAADLAALGRYAMRNTEFRRIVALRKVVIPAPKGGRRVLVNTDALLLRYPGMEGIKTGFTSHAGYSFVSAAKRDGVELFSVVLGTQSASARFAQTKRLLDWGFSRYRVEKVVTTGTVVGTVPVTDYLEKDIVAVTGGSADVRVFDLDGPIGRRYDLRPSVTAPVKAGQPVGEVAVTQAGRVLVRVPVVSAADVGEPGFWERAQVYWTRTWQALFGPAEGRGARVTAS